MPRAPTCNPRLARSPREAKAQDAVVLLLIGHGTFDGADYKFNLPGSGHLGRAR